MIHYNKINRYITDHLQEKISKASDINWGAYGMANQAFDAMQCTIAGQKLAASPPDHTIEIARNAALLN